MQKPKSTKHNSEVKDMLDEDKFYQDIQDQQDSDWWHQLDLELQQQMDEEQAILDDINSKVCPRGKK
tara:strand:+ start:47 stop:247 length:201 start_codon:yes stop_codon:yes gene_type:complete